MRALGTIVAEPLLVAFLLYTGVLNWLEFIGLVLEPPSFESELPDILVELEPSEAAETDSVLKAFEENKSVVVELILELELEGDEIVPDELTEGAFDEEAADEDAIVLLCEQALRMQTAQAHTRMYKEIHTIMNHILYQKSKVTLLDNLQSPF